ncbi:MAG TPA: nuclear transport factor 2 family protein [Anditalea sp.]|nr:nuclear transport factor 2 family protein [Anditalea sp.]
MHSHDEKTAVERLLSEYAGALNSADTAIIPSFYAKDGLFMPNGYNDLSFDNLLDKSKGFFKKVRFHIEYTLPETEITGDYAFVKTIAKTTTTDLELEGEVKQMSRDFFVLRKEKEDWKIYRYIFNNIKVN